MVSTDAHSPTYIQKRHLNKTTKTPEEMVKSQSLMAVFASCLNIFLFICQIWSFCRSMIQRYFSKYIACRGVLSSVDFPVWFVSYNYACLCITHVTQCALVEQLSSGTYCHWWVHAHMAALFFWLFVVVF